MASIRSSPRGDHAEGRKLSPDARRRIHLYGFLLAAVLLSLAVLISTSQAGARRALDERFAARTELAADFLDSYARDVLAREASLATAHLGDASLPDAALEDFSAAFGFEAAVLLDGRGRVLQALPAQAQLIGEDLAARYDHLRTALSGVPTVSRLIPSAVRAEPVVAFATPFVTADGERRVVSGAFHVARTPVADYLAHAMPVSGFRAFLLDDRGHVLAGNETDAGARVEGRLLSEREPQLEAAMRRRPSGTYRDNGRYFFVVVPVGDSPWRLAMAVPSDRLHAPLGPLSRSPWLLFAFVAVGAGVMLNLVRRLYLRASDLEHLSNVDALTGLANRRQVEAAARAVDVAARRFGSTTAVLLVDLDHFKAVNDLFGHAVGDEVLKVTATRIRGALRPQDVVGRLGGEEFVVVLADNDVVQAELAAERIRASLGSPMNVGEHTLTVTASIGCAVGPVIAPLLRDADHALYRAKQAGRDRVVIDSPTPVEAVPVPV